MFRWVLMIGTALGFGAIIGTLPLVERGAAGIHWRFHWAAIPLFAIGFAAGIWFWRLVYRLGISEDDNIAKSRLKRGAFAVLPLGIAGFFYPLRFIDPSRRTEVLIGLTIAIAVLSLVGFVMVNLIKWLNENEPPDGQP
jgi:hypothetical protein